MSLRSVLLLSALAAACRSEGTTKYVIDADHDGIPEEEDCDDNSSSAGRPTNWFNDADGDGHGDAGTGDASCDQPDGTVATSDDCNDADATVYVGAQELCDDLDNDCNGEVDDSLTDATYYTDADGDGYGDDATAVTGCDAPPEGAVDIGGDCNDADPAYNPGADESDCADPADYNCDGSSGYDDADADGFPACEECDDANAAVNPAATESCNEVDDDCDSVIDEDPIADAPTWYQDVDGDGYGDAATGVATCDPGAGWVMDATDCDDARADINPAASEVCDGIDNDCDALVDDNDDSLDSSGASSWYTDADGDGYGDDGSVTTACAAPIGTSALGGDCNDADTAFHPGADESDCTDPTDYNCDGSTGSVDADGDGYAACEECDDASADNHPGADEYCDGTDNNCDGTVDEDAAVDTTAWYADADGDGFGDAGAVSLACSVPSGSLADSTDCDDTRSDVNPAQIEVCDGVDNDCDGTVDVGATDPTNWYIDGDGDGYGDSGTVVSSCDAPFGTTANGDDCNDIDASINPAADEMCDSIDNNCDGAIDDSTSVDAALWYVDGDSDGFGDDRAMIAACDAPAGAVAAGGDCDDGDGAVNPDATEVCDLVDNNCDGAIDEGFASTWYADADGDGFGDALAAVSACGAPAGYVADATDCNDADGAVNPDAAEACDGLDNDCDGVIDNGFTGTWYADADADGYGDASSSVSSCTAPAGYIADGTDCDDGDAAIHPGATEVCDGLDNDCDGYGDSGSATTWYADVDGDGYGNAASTVSACAAPAGYIGDATDCNDAVAAINPGATELCDSVDNNCDGAIDEGLDSTWYADDDGDGYGDASVTATDCAAPSGYVADDTDCDDTDPSANPGEIEVCDAVDNDCNGAIDDGGVCSCDVAEYDGGVYQFCTAGLTWAGAKAACLADGYAFVSIGSSAENTWVIGEAYSTGGGHWWIGATDSATEGTWLWSDGSAASYTNWASGEPNNNGNADCADFGPHGYTWEDHSCSAAFSYICEG